jgi:hypothetical protein
MRLMEDAGVGHLTADAVGDEGDGVGVNDSAYVGAFSIDGLMEREFGGWDVTPRSGTIGVDADDIFTRETPFIDSCRGDPNRAICIADGEIPTGRGRHPIAVDAFHGLHDLIARMDQRSDCVHVWFL